MDDWDGDWDSDYDNPYGMSNDEFEYRAMDDDDPMYMGDDDPNAYDGYDDYHSDYTDDPDGYVYDRPYVSHHGNSGNTSRHYHSSDSHDSKHSYWDVMFLLSLFGFDRHHSTASTINQTNRNKVPLSASGSNGRGAGRGIIIWIVAMAVVVAVAVFLIVRGCSGSEPDVASFDEIQQQVIPDPLLDYKTNMATQPYVESEPVYEPTPEPVVTQQTNPVKQRSPYQQGYDEGYDDGYEDAATREGYNPVYHDTNLSGADRKAYRRGYLKGYREGYEDGVEEYEWEPATGEEDLTDDW